MGHVGSRLDGGRGRCRAHATHGRRRNRTQRDLRPVPRSCTRRRRRLARLFDGVLYLSLTGLVLEGPDRIILLASDDHGSTWRYVETMHLLVDAAVLGFSSFDGSAIAAERERVFLLVTPESPGILHDGTLVIEFESIESGALVRDAGIPVITKHPPALAGLPANRRGG